eukprot:516035-Rhodomonas_salina.7
MVGGAGSKLVGLNFEQLQREADFRASSRPQLRLRHAASADLRHSVVSSSRYQLPPSLSACLSSLRPQSLLLA